MESLLKGGKYRVLPVSDDRLIEDYNKENSDIAVVKIEEGVLKEDTRKWTAPEAVDTEVTKRIEIHNPIRPHGWRRPKMYKPNLKPRVSASWVIISVIMLYDFPSSERSIILQVIRYNM